MKLIDADKILYTDLNSDMPQSKVRVYVAFKERIDEMPTIDAEPVRHGYWEYNDYGGVGNWHCSSCRHIIPLWQWLSDYCPNCGAKMKVKQCE